jgi:hypothetical protein
VVDIVALLIKEFGYERQREEKQQQTKTKTDDTTDGVDWSVLSSGALIDHDTCVSVAMSLLKAEMSDGAVVNLLRQNITALKGVDPERRQRRLDEVPAAVESARRKLGIADVPPFDVRALAAPYVLPDPAKLPKREMAGRGAPLHEGHGQRDDRSDGEGQVNQRVSGDRGLGLRQEPVDGDGRTVPDRPSPRRLHQQRRGSARTRQESGRALQAVQHHADRYRR